MALGPRRLFGAELRHLRMEAGLTQRELANAVCIDFTYLSKLENAKLRPPSEDTIRRMAKVLNADFESLFSLAGVPPKKLKEWIDLAPPEASLLLFRLANNPLRGEDYTYLLTVFDTMKRLKEEEDER